MTWPRFCRSRRLHKAQTHSPWHPASPCPSLLVTGSAWPFRYKAGATSACPQRARSPSQACGKSGLRANGQKRPGRTGPCSPGPALGPRLTEANLVLLNPQSAHLPQTLTSGARPLDLTQGLPAEAGATEHKKWGKAEGSKGPRTCSGKSHFWVAERKKLSLLFSC